MTMSGAAKKHRNDGSLGKIVGKNYDERIFLLDLYSLTFSYAKSASSKQKYIPIEVL